MLVAILANRFSDPMTGQTLSEVETVPMENAELIATRERAIDKLAVDIVMLESTIAMLMQRGCGQRTMADLLRMLADWKEQISIMRDHQAAVS